MTDEDNELDLAKAACSCSQWNLTFFLPYLQLTDVNLDQSINHQSIKQQTQEIEKIQKRAVHIIFNYTRGMPYTSILYSANLSTLSNRRTDLSKKLFLDITQPTSCLHHLLPAPRDQSVTFRLRTSGKYPRVYTRTKRYCSFINFALNNYQDITT